MVYLCPLFDICHLALAVAKNENQTSVEDSWLNGFVLVIARTVVVKGLHFESSVAIVLSIFALCVLLETLAVLALRRYPKVGWVI